MALVSGTSSRRLFIAAAAATAFAFSAPVAFAAGTDDKPAEIVAALGQDLGKLAGDSKAMNGAQRLDAVSDLLHRYFDLPKIAANTIGARRFRGLSEIQQADFVEAYTRFTIASYIRRLPQFDAAGFAVGAVSDGPSGLAAVRATYSGTQSGQSVLDFVLTDTPNGYRIVDLRIDGDISELAVRRAEVSKVLDDKGFDGLITLLRDRTAALSEG